MEFHPVIGDLVKVTNTLTNLRKKVGMVVDVKIAGETTYVRILTDGMVSRIIPHYWVEFLQ